MRYEKINLKKDCDCILAMLFLMLFMFQGGNAFSEEYVQPDALLEMEMQQLMNLAVTSAGKRHEKYIATAAAVYIITNDEIRRAGSVSIPEALTLAPGVEVQHVNANQIAVAIRGHNDVFSDKLLVLMDGRVLYTPTFSGTWWLVQNYPIEDIDRIEVIRGPSGAVWGSNAVNGVINIITKSARETQGVMLSAGAGTEEKGQAVLRYGWRGEQFHMRLYGMSEYRDGGIYDPTVANIWGMQRGADTPDYRKYGQAGLRLDWDISHLSQLSLIGNAYQMKAGAFGYLAIAGVTNQDYVSNNDLSGKNLLMRLDHEFSGDRSMGLQLYFDQTKMATPFFNETRNTYDAEIQFNLPAYMRNTLSLGGGCRLSRSSVDNSAVFSLADKSHRIVSLFIQDDINIIDNRLKLIGGAKLEHNQYSGWESQPSLRGIYTGEGWSLWGAASRTVRAPNLVENGMTFDVKAGPGYVGRVFGDGRTQPERVTAYEVGARWSPNDELVLQATAFKMFYKSVADSFQNNAAAYVENTYLVIPIYLMNVFDGRARGIEVDYNWKVDEMIRLKGSFTHMRSSYGATPIDHTTIRYSAHVLEQQTPENRYHLAVNLNPAPGFEIDLNYWHWDRHKRDRVPRYNRLDARIGWTPFDGMELSLIGKNLLRATHKEDLENRLEASTLQQQSYLLKMVYRY